jgi:tRNA A37 threonylcarbamoyladenosine biosynthesis protein TsaE
MDAYRIEHVSELPALRFEETLADPRTIVLIEWPEKIASALPEKMIRVTCSHVSEDVRNVEIHIP